MKTRALLLFLLVGAVGGFCYLVDRAVGSAHAQALPPTGTSSSSSSSVPASFGADGIDAGNLNAASVNVSVLDAGTQVVTFLDAGTIQYTGTLNSLGGTPWAMASVGGGRQNFNNGTTTAPGVHWYSAANTNVGIDYVAGVMRFVSNLDESGASVMFQVNATTKAFTFGGSPVPVSNAAVDFGSSSLAWRNLYLTGAVVQNGTDSTASPGAATINKPLGKSAIASGASSVVITNNTVVAASVILITPVDADATCTGLRVSSTGSGTFTVSCAANATATTKFNWSAIALF